MFNWIKKNVILSIKVGLTNLKLNVVLAPFVLLSTIVTYLVFKDSLAQNGFWVIFIPMFLTLVLALIYLIPRRNNPNYQIYYLFHLSKISKLIILVAVIFLIGLYFFAQCRDYGFSVNEECFRKILGR